MNNIFKIIKEDSSNIFLDDFPDDLSLEGVSIYLRDDKNEINPIKYIECPKSYINIVYKSKSGKNNPIYYITTDLLSLKWENRLDDLKFLSSPDFSYHEPRIKIKSTVVLEETGWITKLRNEKDVYVGFLSDWIEYLKEYRSEFEDKFKKELLNNGYVV